jgi:DNA polymerase-3 subunit epsilon
LSLVLGLDFETDSLDLETCKVIEVGMVLWDSILKEPVKLISYLVNHPNIDIPEEIQRINGITPALLKEYGIEPEKALRQILQWMQRAECVLAHNGNQFDRIIFRNWCLKLDYDPQEAMTWVDTMDDLELPKKCHKQLGCMAHFHGFLNPFPHRAVFDVMTLIKVLEGYDFEVLLHSARTPSITVQALVSYDDRNKAKDRGFYFKKELGNAWIKRIKKDKLDSEVKEADFKIRVREDL